MPADDSSQEAFRKFKLAEVFRADIVKPRSYQHHKLAFALLNMTYENQDKYTSFEHFRKAVAIAAGHVDELITLEGEVLLQPKSISYSALDEVEFSKVMAEMMRVCAGILGDMDLDELADEVDRYAANHYG